MDYSCSSLNTQTMEELLGIISTLQLDDHSTINNTLFKIEPRIRNERLHIIAQPKASSDSDQNSYHILANDQSNQYKYPTIRIPYWLEQDSKLYIRVTLVTVINDRMPYHYIHPYRIDTIDENVLVDRENNSIYFHLESNDYKQREKSFQISITKKIDHEKSLRLFDHDAIYYENIAAQICQQLKDNSTSHQFYQSQLVFTLAYQNSQTRFPSLLFYTTVKSQVILEQNIDSVFPSNELIRCIPRQSRWHGGEQMIINFPDEIQQKRYTIYFDFGQYGLTMIDHIELFDQKTILFQIPPCLYRSTDNEHVKVWIHIQENNVLFRTIDFSYFALSKCTKKTLENTSKFETQTQLDQYFTKLTDSIETYIRMNDPSKLFRRTRILLLQKTINPTVLHESIENGHGRLVFIFIEQIIDIPSANRLLEARNMNGETVLLVAGRFCEWRIVEFILKKRPNYISQMNKQGQTIVTILANYIAKQKAKIGNNTEKTNRCKLI